MMNTGALVQQTAAELDELLNLATWAAGEYEHPTHPENKGLIERAANQLAEQVNVKKAIFVAARDLASVKHYEN